MNNTQMDMQGFRRRMTGITVSIVLIFVSGPLFAQKKDSIDSPRGQPRGTVSSTKSIIDPELIPIVLAYPAASSGEPSLRARRSQFARGIQPQVYHVNWAVDIPVTSVSIATAFWGLSIVTGKPPLDSMTVVQLDASDVNRFDRSATRQDAGFAITARSISDVTMGISQAMPFLLFMDREVRKEWADVLTLIFETQAITGNLYSWGGAVPFDRIRPMAYNEEVAWDERTDPRNRNSFYSGHTSMSASASIFAAKVFCDFHPELGNSKFLVYSLAAIPPVATGFMRYKGLKHFPTDVITGLIVGAGVGFLVPHLHKKTGPNLTIVPFTGRMNGMALTYRF